MRWLIPILLLLPLSAWSEAQETHRYLFMGHPRDDQPGERVQDGVLRVDYSKFDLLLLGGDYTWRGTGTRATVDYLDGLFNLASPTTLAALGNHDTQNKDYFTDATGRDRFYSQKINDVTFVVLDTTDNSRNITGSELQMLEDTINNLTDSTHLVIVHHHLIWLADYAPLAHLIGSPKIGASSSNLNGLNFHSVVYPLLLEAVNDGVEVICLAGDRTGTDTEEFFVDHTTSDGVRFIGAGLKEELAPELRTVVILEHNQTTGTLTPVFQHLADLPTLPEIPRPAGVEITDTLVITHWKGLIPGTQYALESSVTLNDDWVSDAPVQARSANAVFEGSLSKRFFRLRKILP